MKTISAALEAHIAGTVTTLCYCWKLTRTDGVVMGFTSCGEDIPDFEGVAYKASLGFVRSAFGASIDSAGSSQEIQGFLDEFGITAEALRAGVYDFAELRVFKLNWRNTAQGSMRLGRTRFGPVSIQDGMFVVTLMNMVSQLNQRAVTQAYAPDCRTDLGSSRCRKDLTDFTDTGEVTSVASRKAFTGTLSTARATDFHSEGRIRFDTGANAGRPWLDVLLYASPDSFTLFLDSPYPIAIADQYTIVAGCDRTKPTCIAKFDNLVNFQAEDFLAGVDSMLETPNA